MQVAYILKLKSDVVCKGQKVTNLYSKQLFSLEGIEVQDSISYTQKYGAETYLDTSYIIFC
jgi:hypothetical protein